MSLNYKRKFRELDELLGQEEYFKKILGHFCKKNPQYRYKTLVSVGGNKYVLKAYVYEKKIKTGNHYFDL